MALVSALGLAWLAVLHYQAVRNHVRYLATGLIWAAGIMIILVLAPLLFQFFGPGVLHAAPLSPQFFSGDLAGFVLPTWLQYLFVPALLPIVGQADFIIADFGFYIGLPFLTVLGVLSWCHWRNFSVRFFLGWTAMLAILILGATLRLVRAPVGVPLPDAIIQHIPLLNEFLPVRLDLYLDLSIAILFTIFLDQLNQSKMSRGLRLLAILAVFSWLPNMWFPMSTHNTNIPAIFRTGELPSRGSILVIPLAVNVNSDQAMLWQVVNGFRFSIPEGYFTRPGSRNKDYIGPIGTPFLQAIWKPELGDRLPPVTPKLITAASNYLQQHQVQMTVLGPMPQEAAMRRWLTLVFGRQPTAKEGVYNWHGRPNS
jgi:hypothetical protein